MSDLLVVGSVALDTVKTPFGEVKEVLGGSATYFAFAASFFTDVKLVAVVGEDFPKQHLELLGSRPIDLSGLEIRKGKTFRWSGVYGYDLNTRETIRVALNVFEDFYPVLSPKLRKSPYVFLANIDPELHLKVIEQIKNPDLILRRRSKRALQGAVELRRSSALSSLPKGSVSTLSKSRALARGTSNGLIVCDTMNIWIETKRRTLEKTLGLVDMLVLNDSEARELTREVNLIKAGKSILRMGPKSVVIKKGEHGAIYISKKFFFTIPAYPLESVSDPTGAGDSFAGGFMGYLAKEGNDEKNIKLALAYGTIMASFTVEDFSLERLKKVTNKEIEMRLKEFKNMTHFIGETL